MAGRGCRGSLGVDVNFTAKIQYPTMVWNALLAMDVFTQATVGVVASKLTNPLTINGTIYSNKMDPILQLSDMICPPSAKPPCTALQNITSVLLQHTGTDITFSIKNIMASDVAGDHKPGMSFEADATFSALSPAASKLCAGEEAFCCAGGSSAKPDWCDSS
jgi:hypothetical protein